MDRLPPEFIASWRTGQGAAGDWRVVSDPSATQAKAIEQASADPTDYRFPLAFYEPLAAELRTGPKLTGRDAECD